MNFSVSMNGEVSFFPSEDLRPSKHPPSTYRVPYRFISNQPDIIAYNWRVWYWSQRSLLLPPRGHKALRWQVSGLGPPGLWPYPSLSPPTPLSHPCPGHHILTPLHHPASIHHQCTSNHPFIPRRASLDRMYITGPTAITSRWQRSLGDSELESAWRAGQKLTNDYLVF